MRSLPPSGMASRALTVRFNMTCSIWLGSAFTCNREVSSSNFNATSSPMRRGSIFSMSETKELRFQGAPLGDVLGKNLDVSDCASLVLYRTAAASHDDGRAVFALPFQFKVFEAVLL